MIFIKNDFSNSLMIYLILGERKRDYIFYIIIMYILCIFYIIMYFFNLNARFFNRIGIKMRILQIFCVLDERSD